LAISGHDVKRWRQAMCGMVLDSEGRHRMAAAARARTATRDWTTAFKEFWEDDPYVMLRNSKLKKAVSTSS
jgi:hypothetical protein